MDERILRIEQRLADMLVALRLRGLRVAWTKFDKMRALAAYEAYCGDFELTSEYTGIPVSTLRGWSGQAWWTQELHDSAPVRDKRLADMRLHVWDAAFSYVKRLMSPEIVEAMPIDKLAIAFGILVDKLLLLEKHSLDDSRPGDVYGRLIQEIFGRALEERDLKTREL